MSNFKSLAAGVVALTFATPSLANFVSPDGNTVAVYYRAWVNGDVLMRESVNNEINGIEVGIFLAERELRMRGAEGVFCHHANEAVVAKAALEPEIIMKSFANYTGTAGIEDIHFAVFRLMKSRIDCSLK